MGVVPEYGSCFFHFIWGLSFVISGNFILVCGRGGMGIPPVAVVFWNVHGTITIFPARLRNNIHRGKGQKVKCQWTTKDRVKIMRQWSAVDTHFSCKAALIIGHLFPQSWQVPPSSHLLMSFDTCYGYRLWSSNFHVIISPSYFFWQLRKSVNCRVKGYQFLVCTFC